VSLGICLQEIAILDRVQLGEFVASGQETTMFPVRSALFKQRTGGLVVRWAATGESVLLNVKDFRFALVTSLVLEIAFTSFVRHSCRG
jgi:hypothetical protein